MPTSSRLSMSLTVAALAVVWLGGAPVAQATISEALSLRQLVTQSDHVLVVSCVDARALRDDRARIVTDYALSVEDVLRGHATVGSVVTMRTLGGAIGDLGMRVEGEPHLRVGARYLVFLRALGDGVTLRPVGMSQGVMPLRERGGVLEVLPGGAGLSLRQRVRGGQLIAAPPAIVHPEPLEAVRERIGRVAP